MVVYNYVMATPIERQSQTSTLTSSTVQLSDISDSEVACGHGHEHAYNSDVHEECEEESEKLPDPDRQ